ncbi:MAG: response regulator [Planctomycetes bacterium]|nr:response regulator [Planctomycetota bacterium]
MVCCGATCGIGARTGAASRSRYRHGSSSPAALERVAFGHGEHLLLVDDEPALLRATARNLEHLGYVVTCARDVASALAEFQRDPGRFAAIVTDREMPGANGIDLVRGARAILPDVRVLLCSGYFSPTTRRDALSAGALGLLAKPVATAELSRAIRAMLENPVSATTPAAIAGKRGASD